MSMVDVGQADGFVFEQNGMVAVIDCGTEETVDNLTEYLKERGITTIHLLFGSHPHDDHMGGMAELLEEEGITVEKVIMPDAQGIDTDWYEELEVLLYEGDYDIEFIKEGNVYQLGEATITVLEQQEGLLEDPNNYSAILKITLGEMDVIMTGDARTEVERAVLESGQDISAEILKIGHHGSKTSTSVKFLDAVDPIYALISCEVGNKHKHPTEKIMERLEERGIVVYRTDECGTVVLTITSTDVTFNCEPGDYLSGTELKEKVGKK
jgi:beta-lactamase superfamily II metal-dependent hydrolase